MTGLNPSGYLPHGDLPASAKTPASISTLRWSSHGYTSAPSDSPANTHYDGKLAGEVRFEQGISIGAGLLGRAALGFGEISLWDGDGTLASLLNSYAIDGRDVRLKVASGKGARIGAWPATASFSTIFRGTAAGWRRDAKSVRVRLRDTLSKLDVPVQTEFYGGGGGLDGPNQLKGLPKPQTWGRAFNVPAVYLGVIDLGAGALATYQVHHRAISGVLAVRERGAAITEVTSGTPGLGQYRTFAASGVFQLGFTPAGIITADVAGDAVPSYAFTPAKLLKRIGQDICGMASTDFDDASLDDFDADTGGAVGVFVGPGDRPRAIDVVETIVGGAGGFLTQKRTGELRAGVLAAPDATPHAYLDAGDIRSIEPLDLPDQINPPPKRLEVGYSRNYSPSEDLAGAVTGDLRAWLAQSWRSAAAFDGTVATAHVLAQQMSLFPSSFIDEAPAAAMAANFLALYAPGRRRFRILTGRYLGQLEVGYTVQVTFPLFGLSTSFRGVIESIAEEWGRGLVEITIFG